MTPRSAAGIATLVVVVVACTQDPAPSPSPSPPVATASDAPSPSTSPTTPAPTPAPQPSPAAAPAPISVDRTATHPAGVTVTVSEVLVGDVGVQVTFAVDNAANDLVVLASQPAWTYAVDDGGARLDLVPPEDNPQLRVEAGDTLTGTMAFGGVTAPGAETFDVRFNYQDGEPRNPDGGPQIVSLLLEDLPLTAAGGDAVASRAAQAPADGSAERDGVRLEVRGVRVGDDGGIYLDARAVNGRDATTFLAFDLASTHLRDDLGNLYRLRPPADDPELELESDEELTGELAFVGPPAQDAGSLQLFVNADRDDDELLYTRSSQVDGPISLTIPDLPLPRPEGG